MSLQGNLEELYKEIYPEVKKLVSQKDFNLTDLAPVVQTIVKSVQAYNDRKGAGVTLTGTQKQEIALTLLHVILAKLRDERVISPEVYAPLLSAVDFLAPVLFTQGKKLYDYIVSQNSSTETVVSEKTKGQKCCLSLRK